MALCGAPGNKGCFHTDNSSHELLALTRADGRGRWRISGASLAEDFWKSRKVVERNNSDISLQLPMF